MSRTENLHTSSAFSSAKHMQKPVSPSTLWKRRNKEHVRAKFLEWKAKNKEHRTAYLKTRYQKRKALVKEQDAERYMRPENAAKRVLLKGKKKVYMRDWMTKNPEKKRYAVNKRRALKLKTRVGPLKPILEWERRWRALFQVRCYWCLRTFEPSQCHSDHVIPLEKKGIHDLGNLCIACAPCNLRKHDKTLARWNREIEQPVLF